MDEKRKMQEILNHSLSGLKENPFLSQRVIAQGKGEEPVKKRVSFSVVIIIAILLFGTMTALAAGVEDINAMLYKIWPEAARALRPLNLSDEVGGIRLDVLSASLTDDQLLITYSLTDLEGDRINADTSCSAIIEIPWMNRGDGSDEMLSFDAETHQAVYASYLEYTSSSFPEGTLFDSATITFRVNGLRSSEQKTLDLWPLMTDQDYTAEAVTAPPESGVDAIVRDDNASEMEKTLPNILNPANNLHIPITDDIELSGIGWLDGNLHVQIHVANYAIKVEYEHAMSDIARYTSYINLRDHNGNDVMWAPGFFDQLLKDKPYFIWGINWREGDEQWIEKIFPVQPEEMDQYIIYGEFTNHLMADYEDLLQYEWQVSFPSNMIQAE